MAAQHHKVSKLAEQNSGAKSFVTRLLGLFRRKRRSGRPAHNQQEKALADARRAEIVACAVAAGSLTEAGKQYDLSRERVRQLCARAGVSIRPIRAAMVAERKAKELAAKPPRPNPAERFLSYVEKTPTCWTWKGATNHHNMGWGLFHLNQDGKYVNVPAHRAAWLLFNGAIPPEKLPCGRSIWRVSQTCNNKLCVNPDHLALRTQKEVVAKREALRAAGAYGAPEQRRRTHCKRGHEFTPENTYSYGTQRFCRACARVRQAQYYQNHQSTPTEAVHV